ncbi:MAG: RCC1 domain-containing protein [Cetobacterium sp.]
MNYNIDEKSSKAINNNLVTVDALKTYNTKVENKFITVDADIKKIEGASLLGCGETLTKDISGNVDVKHATREMVSSLFYNMDGLYSDPKYGSYIKEDSVFNTGLYNKIDESIKSGSNKGLELKDSDILKIMRIPELASDARSFKKGSSYIHDGEIYTFLDDSGIKIVESGYYTLFIADYANNIYACGYNGTGCLGDGTNVNVNALKRVQFSHPDNANIVNIISNDTNCVILQYDDNTLYASGNNAKGSLGIGTTTGTFNFVKVKLDITEKIKMVSIGGQTDNAAVMVLTEEGSVYAWGNNTRGGLGIGTTVAEQPIPIRLNTYNIDGKIIEVIASGFAGDSITYLLTDTNKLYASGRNVKCELLDGTTTDKSTHVLCTAVPPGKIEKFCSTGYSVFWIQVDGRLYSGGESRYNNSGNYNFVSTVATPLKEMTYFKNRILQAHTTGNVHSTSGYIGYGSILTEDGEVFISGLLWWGLGLGSDTTLFRQIAYPQKIKRITPSRDRMVAFAEDGTIYVHGRNTHGELGLGCVFDTSTAIYKVMIPPELEKVNYLKVDHRFKRI